MCSDVDLCRIKQLELIAISTNQVTHPLVANDANQLAMAISR